MYAHYEIARFRHAELLAIAERRRHSTRPTSRSRRRGVFPRRPAI